MNKLVYLLIIVIAFACSETKNENALTSTDAKPVKDTAEYALALDSAVIFTKRYDSLAQATLKEAAPIRAYTIRSADLLEALGLPETTPVKYSHVRAYMGMDMNNTFRLFLTPVSGADIDKGIAGSDVILTGPFSKGLKKNGNGVEGTARVEDGSYVLDFTAPCPNTCPSDSPLNQ